MPGSSRAMLSIPPSLLAPAPRHLPARPLPPTWAFTFDPRQVPGAKQTGHLVGAHYQPLTWFASRCSAPLPFPLSLL